MSKYYSPYKVSEGPDTGGFFRVEDQNTFKVVGFHRSKDHAQEFARMLNLAYSEFANNGGLVNP